MSKAHLVTHLFNEITETDLCSFLLLFWSVDIQISELQGLISPRYTYDALQNHSQTIQVAAGSSMVLVRLCEVSQALVKSSPLAQFH